MSLLSKFFKKNEQESDFEEVSEKPTSTAGYFLLLLMFIFILVVGNTIIHDLRGIPDRPARPASCLQYLATDNSTSENWMLSYRESSNVCKFTEVDNRFQLKALWENFSKELKSISDLNGQISIVEADLNSNSFKLNKAEKDLENLAKQYDLSLQEIMAGVPVILNNTSIVQQIEAKRLELQTVTGTEKTLTDRKNTLTNNRNSQVKKLNTSSNLAALKKAYSEATEYYLDKHAVYNFILFLLELLFVLPFFLVALYFYLKLKRKNSPHTIIWTAILASASVLFLEATLEFLYKVLPLEWLKRIFTFLLEIPALRYIIYYGSVVLVILVFGGIVYYIQKRVFNPQKVALRRLKDNKCPKCSFLLNPEHNFCPKCRQQLKSKCIHCGQARIEYLNYCPVCGQDQKQPSTVVANK